MQECHHILMAITPQSRKEHPYGFLSQTLYFAQGSSRKGSGLGVYKSHSTFSKRIGAQVTPKFCNFTFPFLSVAILTQNRSSKWEMWFPNLKTITKKQQCGRKLNKKMRLMGMGKPIVIFMAIRATENK